MADLGEQYVSRSEYESCGQQTKCTTRRHEPETGPEENVMMTYIFSIRWKVHDLKRRGYEKQDARYGKVDVMKS